MTVIARDVVAADHLVYAWPLPIGVECDVTCGDEDTIVMCPAWLVGDQLGPGNHHWRTPDPTRPTSAYFVRKTPVEVGFDVATTFLLPGASPANGPTRVRLIASGAVQVRCADPSWLVAQFVGLPFDSVNEGILRSVSRSVERMLARLLTRRVVLAGTPAVVTDPAMLPQLVEELVAYNPAAGAVFGVELLRVVRLVVNADEGVAPNRGIHQTAEWGRVGRAEQTTATLPVRHIEPTLRGHRPSTRPVDGSPADGEDSGGDDADQPEPTFRDARGAPVPAAHGDDGAGPGDGGADGKPAQSQTMRHAAVPAPGRTPVMGVAVVEQTPPLGSVVSASGEIVLRPSAEQLAPRTSGLAAPATKSTSPTLSGIAPLAPLVRKQTSPDGAPPGEVDGKPLRPITTTAPPATTPIPPPGNATPLGHAAVDAALIDGLSGRSSGEISLRMQPGARVRIAAPDGSMQSATVRQLLQGYYELELGATGETIWVPAAGVMPE